MTERLEMAQEATSPRQRLGRELRKLRRLAGLSGQELASRIGITQTRVSRIETAAYRPSPTVVRDWLTATGAEPDVRAELLGLAGEAQLEATSWRAVFRGSMAGRQKVLAAQDAIAVRIRHFQPFMIPGLLQTEAYAEAVLRAVATREPSDGELAETVAQRMERGRRLREDPGQPEYHLILTESGLQWSPIGLEPADRKAAIAKVIDAAVNSQVEVRVIATGTPTVQAPMSNFVVYDYAGDEPPTVDVELAATELRFAGHDEVSSWNVAWDRMIAAAQDPKASIRLMRRLLKE